MLLITVQLMIAVVLVGVALRVHSRLNAKSSDDLTRITKKLMHSDWGFHEVSYGSIFSEGLSVSAAETWNGIHGLKGLWRIFWNVGVLVELADYVAATNEANPHLSSTVRELRVSAVKVRTLVMAAFLEHILTFGFKKKESLRAYIVTTGYSTVVARVSYLFQDYSPSKLNQYIYAMTAL